MNSLLSYYGLVDAKIRDSDKDLPVKASFCWNSNETDAFSVERSELDVYWSSCSTSIANSCQSLSCQFLCRPIKSTYILGHGETSNLVHT